MEEESEREKVEGVKRGAWEERKEGEDTRLVEEEEEAATGPLDPTTLRRCGTRRSR